MGAAEGVRVFTADPYHSSIYFSLAHMGVGRFRASFREVEAQLSRDGEALSLAGKCSVESISIVAPPELRSRVVDGEDFFDATRYPELTFASDEFALDGENAVIRGKLTMKGVSYPIEAMGTLRGPVANSFGGRSLGLQLTAMLDRRCWGLDWQTPLPTGDDVLGWDVAVTAELEFHEAS